MTDVVFGPCHLAKCDGSFDSSNPLLFNTTLTSMKFDISLLFEIVHI